VVKLKNNVQDINREIEKSNIEKEQMQKQLNSIYDNVAEIVKLFKSKFFLLVATKMDYDLGVGFTESNVT